VLCCASLPHFVAVLNVISNMLVPCMYTECVVGRWKTLDSCWKSWVSMMFLTYHQLCSYLVKVRHGKC